MCENLVVEYDNVIKYKSLIDFKNVDIDDLDIYYRISNNNRRDSRKNRRANLIKYFKI